MSTHLHALRLLSQGEASFAGLFIADTPTVTMSRLKAMLTVGCSIPPSYHGRTVTAPSTSRMHRHFLKMCSLMVTRATHVNHIRMSTAIPPPALYTLHPCQLPNKHSPPSSTRSLFPAHLLAFSAGQPAHVSGHWSELCCLHTHRGQPAVSAQV